MNTDNPEFNPKILSQLMSEEGISEAELARRTEVPPATINRLIAGATPDPRLSTIRPFARYYKCSIDQLIGDESLTSLRLSEKFTIIPIIPWAKAPAYSEFVKTLNFKNWTKWEAVNITIGQHAYALTVEQRTLGMPFIYQTTLIVDPNKEAKDGDYIIVYQENNESIVLKRLVVEGKDKYLHTPNQSFQSILMSDDYKICGVIVRAVVPFD